MTKLRNRILSTLLALVMLLGLAPTLAPPARASTNTYTDRLDFTIFSGSASGEGWQWVQETQTLTLTNIDLTVADFHGINLPGGSTIVGVGTVNIRTTGADYYTIQVWGDLTIKGDIASISSANRAIIASSIIIDSGCTIGSITTTGSSRYGDGIYADSEDLIINGTVGNITSSTATGIYTGGAVSITKTGTVGTITSNLEYGILGVSTVTINGSVGAIHGGKVGIYADDGGTININTDVTVSGGNGSFKIEPTLTGGREVDSWSKNTDGTNPETGAIDWSAAKYVKILRPAADHLIKSQAEWDALIAPPATLTSGDIIELECDVKGSLISPGAMSALTIRGNGYTLDGTINMTFKTDLILEDITLAPTSVATHMGTLYFNSGGSLTTRGTVSIAGSYTDSTEIATWGIHSSANLTITDTGSLTVTGGAVGSSCFPAIQLGGSGNLTIAGGSPKFIGTAASTAGAYGASIDGDLIISGGNPQFIGASASKNPGSGATVIGDLIVSGDASASFTGGTSEGASYDTYGAEIQGDVTISTSGSVSFNSGSGIFGLALPTSTSTLDLSGLTGTFSVLGTISTDQDIIYPSGISEGDKYVSPATSYTLNMCPSLEDATVTINPDTYTYSGQFIEPAATVTLNGEVLTPTTDYTVSYRNNINAGTAIVIITGCGGYSGVATGTFTIAPADFDNCTMSANIQIPTYTGSPIIPSHDLSADGKFLILNRDYTVSASDNVNVGNASLTFTGKGNYTGTKKYTFAIGPAELYITAISETVQVGGNKPAQYRYIVSGLKGNDTKDIVSGVTFSLDKPFSSTAATTFTIIPSGGTAASGNYTIYYLSGTLYVTNCEHGITSVSTILSTCNDEGLVEQYCNTCNAVFSTTILPALGHSFGDYKNNTATCTEGGKESAFCSNVVAGVGCNMVLTRDTEALGHTWDNGDVTTEPTATTPGEKTFTCTRTGCGDTYTESIPATGGGGSFPIVTPEPTPEWSNPFADVKDTAWYYDDVRYVVENGLFSGTSATKFSPNTSMTRAMLVTALWRLAGEPKATTASSFSDVSESDYYYDAAAWAHENGIVLGYSNGSFGGADKITREQLVTMLWRYAKWAKIDVSVGEDTNILSYNDALSISEYAFAPFQWACGEGIITGKPGGLLAPKGRATRAEAAAMLHRFMLAAQ